MTAHLWHLPSPRSLFGRCHLSFLWHLSSPKRRWHRCSLLTRCYLQVGSQHIWLGLGKSWSVCCRAWHMQGQGCP